MNKTIVMSGLLFFACQGFSQEVNESMSVRIVELDVKVTDWRDGFISGLGKGDFKLLENGKQQVIDSCEEVSLTELPAEESITYQPRVMIVVDFKNSTFSRMDRTLPVLRKYIEETFDQSIQLGLSVNEAGYRLILPFTKDRQRLLAGLDEVTALYEKSPYRILDAESAQLREAASSTKRGRMGRKTSMGFVEPGQKSVDDGGWVEPVSDPRDQKEKARRINDWAHDRFAFSEMAALRQYVNYLSAYEGKKAIILVSELWSRPFAEKDLQPIVNTCAMQNISLNVVSLVPQSDSAEEDGRLTGDIKYYGVLHNSGLGTYTAGMSAGVSAGNVGKMVDKVIHYQSRYYRLRYYTDMGDKDFRKLDVSLPGTSYQVSSYSGFFAQSTELTAPSTTAEALRAADAQGRVDLHLDAQMLSWHRDGLKHVASYVISQRVYSQEGLLLGERVVPGRLEKRKKKEQVFIDHSYQLSPEVAQLVLTIVDLESGQKMVLNQGSTDD